MNNSFAEEGRLSNQTRTSLASSDTGSQATQESEVKIATALAQKREKHTRNGYPTLRSNATQSGRQFSNGTAMIPKPPQDEEDREDREDPSQKGSLNNEGA